MHSTTQRTITVFSVDQMSSPPKAKLVLPRSSPTSWGYDSPMSCKGFDDGAAACTKQFLAVPIKVQGDPYTTPTHKTALGDQSNSEKWERAQKQLKAPKKRN